MQNIGNKDEFLATIDDPAAKAYAKINYGPWDEMDGLKPFIDGVGEKPAGARFYPEDMTKEEFNAFDNKDKTSLYTLIKRTENGGLKTVWYHEAFKNEIEKASDLLLEASELAGDKEFSRFLKLRAEALLTDNYQESDMAWLDVKNNNVDLVIGPLRIILTGCLDIKRPMNHLS
ncbi:MAG: hypothetical protein R2750_02810 [Bacteroidales bacterium]